MFRIAAAVVLFAASSLAAQERPGVSQLMDALGLEETVDILRTEGLENGRGVREDLFPGQAEQSWDATLRRIYDADRMAEEIEEGIGAALGDDEVDVLVGFFDSDRGRRIIDREIEARRELIDPAVEDEAAERLDRLRRQRAPILEALRDYAEANNLVEENLVGALNDSFAFHQGMREGDQLPFEMSEEEVLADVWSQEAEMRDSIERFIYAYMLRAYEPLPEGDLEAYTAFSRTEPGQALNRALFDAFNTMLSGISRELGRAATRYLVSETL